MDAEKQCENIKKITNMYKCTHFRQEVGNKMNQKPAHRVKRLTKQIVVEPTFLADIDDYLSDKGYKKSDLIEFAVDFYLMKDYHSVYDITDYGIPEEEIKSEVLSLRMTEDLKRRISAYAGNHKVSLSHVIYQALVEWLYVQGKIKK